MKKRDLFFVVLGMPASQGSKRFVGTTKSGKGIMIEQSERLRPWRDSVVYCARMAHCGRAPLDGPLRAVMVFTMPRPKKPKYDRPAVAPDLSKLARSTEDALKDAGVITDDSRIVEYDRLAKVYPGQAIEALGNPGVSIRLYEI